MPLYDFICKDIEFTQTVLLEKNIKIQNLTYLLKDRINVLSNPHNIDLFSRFLSLPELEHVTWSIQNGVVQFESELSQDQATQLEFVFKAFRPWRKGPFSFNSVFIDSEWQSQLKWDRLIPFLPCLEGKRLLDLGCGNGY